MARKSDGGSSRSTTPESLAGLLFFLQAGSSTKLNNAAQTDTVKGMEKPRVIPFQSDPTVPILMAFKNLPRIDGIFINYAP